MKRQLSFLIIFITAVLLLLDGCKKESEQVKQASGVKDLSENHAKINRTIKDFISQMEAYRANPDLKSSQTISADSALWYLESTINYAHTFPNEYYVGFETDTFDLTIQKNPDGRVDLSEITGKYEAMKAAVAQSYHDAGFPDKGLVLVDLEETSHTEDYLVIQVRVVTGDGSGTPPPVGVDGPFVEGDDWWYGENAGKCDPHTYESDAADQLKLAMNAYIPDPSGNYYFIGLVQITKTGGDPDLRRPSDPEPPDNIYDYYLYSSFTLYGPVGDDILCLSYTEMNVYFQYLRYLLYFKIPTEELPEDYSVESVIGIIGEPESINGQTHYYQRGQFQFGIKVFYEQGEGPSGL
jgi:hypothetical protein